MTGTEQVLQPPAEPGSFRLVATLTVAGLLSGLLLAGVYAATLPAIERNRRQALRAAVFEVVPGSAALQQLVLVGDSFRPRDATGPKDTGPKDTVPRDAASVYAAYDDGGRCLGYAIPGKGPGFQDAIALIYGYDPRRQRVVGMRVLESRETPGLGDKIFKDEAFVAEFTDLAVAPEITVVKHGTGSAPNEVDGITGATISSKAVVRILNERNAALLALLPPPDQAPPLPPRAPPDGDREEPR